MCGIAGIWNLNRNQIGEETAANFLNSMKDRGPDGAGLTFLEENSLFLGHRRLSILELSDLGKQPMRFAEHLYITFNGEIYNFIEIRQQLIAKKYSFKTDSDTEVLLAAYHAWGKEMLSRLNGMFVFCIYNAHDKKMLLARDRFGVKPLHYTFNGGCFAFASETFAFRYLDGFKRVVNAQHLAISIDNPEHLEGTGHTIYHDVFQLLPGHLIELDINTKRVNQQQWWATSMNLVDVPKTYEGQVERFKELFNDACRIRLRSDVPVASALSGGLDSSAIYCTINELLSKGQVDRLGQKVQKAFVAWYPNTPNDERAFAEEVLKFTNTEAVFIETAYSDLVNELTKTTVRFDAISGTPIMCATDVYKAMAANGYKVSMDGHGADEMLYGYKQMVMDAYETAVRNGDKQSQMDLLDIYTGLFFDDKKAYASSYLSNYGNNFRSSFLKSRIKKILTPFTGKSLVRNEYEAWKTKQLTSPWLMNRIYDLMPSLSLKHYAGHLDGDAEAHTYNMFHYTSLPANLRDFDRASMQSSIEIRSPFMDYRLVSFVFSLPLKSKLGGGYTKRILRDALVNQMPESIRTRKLKIGLSAPLVHWFNGSLKEYLADTVNSGSFQSQSYWNGKELATYVNNMSKEGWSDFMDCAAIWKYINAHMILSK